MLQPRWRTAADLGLLVLWLFATIGARPLLLPDEGRYAGVAFEMLHGSAWVPTLNGLPFFHKPPLLYWTDMLAAAVFGVGAAVWRVGPALFGWALGAALFLHMRRWHGLAGARLALLVLATSPLYFLGAQYVNHDIGVAACVTAAILAWVRAVDDPAQTSRRWLLAGWALCGLGVLAKGLIGVALPLLVTLPWLLAQRRWRQALGLLHPLGLAALALIALPWMLAMQRQFPGFYDYFVVEQHVRRFAGMHFNNVEPAWFLWVVLPLTMLPWSLWLWPGRQPAFRLPGPRIGLYLWWLLVVVGFFSWPASKLVGYVMPALAPAAALLTLLILRRGGRWQAWSTAAAVLCLSAIAGLAWKGPVGHADLAQALAERWQSGDRLVYIESHPYDLRLLAGVTAPAIVVSDWDDPELPRRDNWRKELLDASRFAPETGHALLWRWDRFAQLACHAGRTWAIASAEHQGRLAAWHLERRGRHADLWSAGPLDCRVTPAAP